jgi:molybdate transport system substrate-binding protein
MTRLLCILSLALGLLGCGRPNKDTVTVCAAMSTKEVIEEIGRQFEAETGTAVVCVPAASSTLALQIEQGSDGDLFLSADERWVDHLDKAGLAAQRRNLLANRLVVVIPADSPATVRDLDALAGNSFHQLAVALDSVPAGRYARASLQKAGVWDRVNARVREGGDVRAVLTVVARGEADAGFVYATDAATSDKVRVALEVPEGLHQPIRYPLVLVRRESIKTAARKLYDYLGGSTARTVFEKAGFRVLASGGQQPPARP